MQDEKHSMVTIVHPINALVSAEYDRAAAIHGTLFASAHEGYGVIAEELQEAGDEVERIEAVMYQLLNAIRQENAKAICDYADYIRGIAVNGAAELVQLAAMCDKLVKTVREENA